MAAINLAFESFEDMAEFAGKIAGLKTVVIDGKVLGESVAKGISAPAPQQESAQPAVQQQVPQQPAQAYGQQIASNFPQANTGAAKQPVQQPVPQQPVQTNTQAYTLDDLAGAAMVLMDKGMQAQLQQLLTGYGVESLPALPQEQYGNFATALRGMGAQI